MSIRTSFIIYNIASVDTLRVSLHCFIFWRHTKFHYTIRKHSQAPEHQV